MPKYPTASSKYLKDLLAKFPDAPAKTLARKAYKEQPRLWTSLTTCYSQVRYYLGVRGQKNRKRTASREFHREPRKAGWSDVIPEALVELPDWKAKFYEGPLRVLVLSDVHIPFHDAEALAVALDYGASRKPNMILLNGDIADHYAMSRWETDPRKRDFKREKESVVHFLAGIRKRYKKCRIVIKHGNHEERYDRWMRFKAPELLDVADFRWETVFQLEQNKIELIQHKRPIRLGKLNVIHGHEYVFAISNPVNPARGLFLKGKTHAICGHFHQTSHHSEKNLDGTVMSTWSTGALCNLHPEYRPLNNWNHGFAFVEIGKDGSFHVDNLRIVKGRVW